MVTIVSNEDKCNKPRFGIGLSSRLYNMINKLAANMDDAMGKLYVGTKEFQEAQLS